MTVRQGLLAAAVTCLMSGLYSGSADATPLCPTTTLDRKVAKLTNKLVAKRRSTVQEAVDQLLALGPSVVPSLVCRMNDRRLTRPHLLAYPSESFESLAHYYPAKVVDVLDVVLSVLTPGGPACGLSDESTDAARTACEAAWSEWTTRDAGASR
jgi:hypothetical protein